MEVNIESVIQELQSASENVEKYVRVQKLANVGSMVGGIAHKFNNILGGILGYAQLLKEELPSDSESYRKASVIESAAKRASRLILQLHLFSSQKHTFKKRAVDPRGLVAEIMTIAESVFNPNIEIQTEIRHSAQCVQGDFQSLSLVLLNVVLNAREAMHGGGKLRIETRVETVKKVSYVVFQVVDTGIGIPPENFEQIFDPFFSTKEDPIASGFGLTVAKEILEAHDGFIEIHSKPGEGTSVFIFLPTAQTRPFVPLTKEEPEEIQGEGKVVMVVDDEPELREMAKSIFERKGFRVLLADSGENAIKLFNKNAPNIELVILDMILPGPNGNQVYHEIKKHEQQPKIILTSGLSKDSPALEFADTENEFFVPKPWDLPGLIHSVGRLLQNDET
jgi:CheY-like chemotaxis protein